jgi:hypothetical protein
MEFWGIAGTRGTDPAGVTTMSLEIFEARWKCLRELRDAGHEELEDLVGGTDGLGAALRTGLLVQVDKCCEWQRYQGLVPTEEGEEFMIHVAEHHLIMVHRDRKMAMREVLAQDPQPGAPLELPQTALPCGLEPAPPAKPIKRTDFDPMAELRRLRQAELECWLIEGYEEFTEFCQEHGISEERLLASDLLRLRDGRDLEHAVEWIPTGKGEHYLLLIAAWDLLLVKPEMGRNLFMLLDPDRARGWMAA